jgi:uncharacterized repeat protein (TIGR01451 family)
MHDVAMRRRPAALVIAALLAMLVVGGAMLFGMGKPAQSQSVPEPPCAQANPCLDKTASSSLGSNTVAVGEPITFTINQRCPGAPGCDDFTTLVDTLPAGAEFTDVSVPAGCTLSGNTVTCPGARHSSPTQPFTMTIVATPTECGEFTNTVGTVNTPSPDTARVTFTVVRCPPQTKEECKNGGWSDPEFAFPDQGRCVSAVNRENRQ